MKDRGPNWADRPLREVINHLSAEHHDLLRNRLFGAAMILDELIRLHGATWDPLRHKFRVFSEHLLMHIDREEIALFPVAVAIDEAWTSREPVPADREQVRSLIGHLTAEQATVIRLLADVMKERKEIAVTADKPVHEVVDLIDGIEPHLNACLDLEREIVFPRVLALLEETSAVEVS